MNNEEMEYGVTLHMIDGEYDTGNIVICKKYKLDYKLSVFENLFNLIPIAQNICREFLDIIINGDKFEVIPQNISKGKYYSYPSIEIRKKFKNRGFLFLDEKKAKKILINKIKECMES
jgi:methionyl-tRNA formyltransferase